MRASGGLSGGGGGLPGWLSLSVVACLASVASAQFVFLPYYCSLGYPISTANLVADYDVGCGFNTSSIPITNGLPTRPQAFTSSGFGAGFPWFSRVNNGTSLAPPVALPRFNSASPRTAVAARGVYTLSVPAAVQIAFPIDISPSKMPNCSVELLANGMSPTVAHAKGWGAKEWECEWDCARRGIPSRAFVSPRRVSIACRAVHRYDLVLGSRRRPVRPTRIARIPPGEPRRGRVTAAPERGMPARKRPLPVAPIRALASASSLQFTSVPPLSAPTGGTLCSWRGVRNSPVFVVFRQHHRI